MGIVAVPARSLGILHLVLATPEDGAGATQSFDKQSWIENHVVTEGLVNACPLLPNAVGMGDSEVGWATAAFKF